MPRTDSRRIRVFLITHTPEPQAKEFTTTPDELNQIDFAGMGALIATTCAKEAVYFLSIELLKQHPEEATRLPTTVLTDLDSKFFVERREQLGIRCPRGCPHIDMNIYPGRADRLYGETISAKTRIPVGLHLCLK